MVGVPWLWDIRVSGLSRIPVEPSLFKIRIPGTFINRLKVVPIALARQPHALLFVGHTQRREFHCKMFALFIAEMTSWTKKNSTQCCGTYSTGKDEHIIWQRKMNKKFSNCWTRNRFVQGLFFRKSAEIGLFENRKTERRRNTALLLLLAGRVSGHGKVQNVLVPLVQTGKVDWLGALLLSAVVPLLLCGIIMTIESQWATVCPWSFFSSFSAFCPANFFFQEATVILTRNLSKSGAQCTFRKQKPNLASHSCIGEVMRDVWGARCVNAMIEESTRWPITMRHWRWPWRLSNRCAYGPEIIMTKTTVNMPDALPVFTAYQNTMRPNTAAFVDEKLIWISWVH